MAVRSNLSHRIPSGPQRVALSTILCLAALAWAQAAAGHAWTPTGNLTVARSLHMATLLPNGRVLVAGGSTASAELYDPARGTWGPTGSLATTSHNCGVATVLTDGRVLVAGGNTSMAEVYDPTSGTWSVTGSLGVARCYPTATRLLDGRVLVAGGYSGGGSLASAELYDPALGTWTPAGDLVTARYVASAAMLKDGRVLVAGGAGENGLLASAELYDPQSGTWAPTGGLSTPRYLFTATGLPDGRVLAVGGYVYGGALASAEIYDAATGAWTPTGGLATGRYWHSATLLPEGLVLAAGGYDSGGGYLSSAELYDPEAGTWRPGGAMIAVHAVHTATLLPDGRVLVAGGNTAVAELFDPRTPAWGYTASATGARYRHSATLLPDGRVLAAGGFGPDGLGSDSELYDPRDDLWTPRGSLARPRYLHSATLLGDGSVVAVGGYGAVDAIAETERYEPVSGTWLPGGDLISARYSHTATLLPDGSLLIAGGYNAASGYLGSAERYDPETGLSESTGDLSQPRYYHSATLLADGRVLVAGGYNAADGYLSDAELYDPSEGTWTPTGDLAARRFNHTATLLPDGRVLVAGGSNQAGPVPGAELYDPQLGTWGPAGTLAHPADYRSATLLPDGRVLLAGGLGPLAHAEVYDPARNAWADTVALATGRWGHTATLLTAGQVLVAGGIGDGGYLSGGERYDLGLGYDPAWRPVLDRVGDGGLIEIEGAGLRGLSQGSCGNLLDSATDYPLVQLRRLDNEQTVWLRPAPGGGFSDRFYRSAPLLDFPPGPALVTLYANAIPSESHPVQVSDLPAVSFAEASQSVGEGDGTVRLAIRLSMPTGQPVAVPFSLGGTASLGTDYSLSPEPIRVPAGTTGGQTVLTLLQDRANERDETIEVRLGMPSGAALGEPAVHTLTILDDEQPKVAFAASAQTVSEGIGTVTVSVRLTASKDVAVTVPFTLSGTATGGGVDFAEPPGPILIPAGETEGAVTFSIADDALDEARETVVLTLGIPLNGYRGWPRVHKVAIGDDDPMPRVSFASAGQTVDEGAGVLTLGVQLSTASGREVSVPVLLAGTATGGGVDYSGPVASILIPAGETSATLNIELVDDAVDEPDEWARLGLGVPTNAARAAPSWHRATILDNDPEG